MTRTSNDDIDQNGTIRNGYDYELQVWVKNYECQSCAHPMFMRERNGGLCCDQMKYAGLDIRTIAGREARQGGAVHASH